MTCTCCGDEMDLPGGLVATAPKVSRVLCDGCGERWESSPSAGLHRQLVGRKEWTGAVSQYENWAAVEAGRAT